MSSGCSRQRCGWLKASAGVTLLGGSWVVISGVISTVTILVTLLRGLITLLITTHEPPSRGSVVKCKGSGLGCKIV